MFQPKDAFSGFSVTDLDAAREFYSEKLGLRVAVNSDMDTLRITLPGGQSVFVYPKPDHQPATFTILNFVVDDVDSAVDELNANGVKTKIYDDAFIATDDKGISRDMGPVIAWFRDPAGNVLSVLQADLR